MKKYLMFAAVLGMALTSCEDVPAPYEIFSQGDGSEDTDKTTLINETFATSLGSFSSVASTGSYDWSVSYSSAQVTAFVSNKNNAAMSWLVSSAVDCSEVESAHISFDYILRYSADATLKDFHQLLISKDYDGNSANITNATWTPLEFYLVQGADWNTWYSSGSINVPAEYLGGKLYVALRYQSTTSKAGTWEVKNFLMETGAGDYVPGSDSGDTGGGGSSETGGWINETFASSLGVFSAVNTVGNYSWVIDYSCAKVTAYDSDAKTNNEAESWLVSSAVNTAGTDSAHISFDYILRYANESTLTDYHQLLVSKDYDGVAANISKATWTPLAFNLAQGSDWKTWNSSGSVNIPAEYLGGNLYIALRYKSDTTKAGTWEVKNFVADKGAGETSGGGSGSGSGGSTTEATGTGTEDDPYNVTKIISSIYHDGDTTKGVWIHAYIVGYIPTGGISSTTFGAPATVATNIVVADAADESDYKKCMTIQLPSGSLRTAVNLKDNESNYKKEVWLYGDIIKYCSGPGMKNTTKYKLGEAGGSTGGSTGGNTGGTTSGDSYTLASTIAAGTYLIGANVDGTYKLATNLGSSKTYGYLSGVDATATDGAISSATATEAWTIKADGDAYTIQDSDGRYLYMKGTYNSFNADATKPSEGATWKISIESDKTVKIVNVLTSKTVQWSTQYSSFGAYTDVTNVVPSLFVKK